MSDFEDWLQANLARSAFAAEQLRREAERRRQEEEMRPSVRLELPIEPAIEPERNDEAR